MLPKDLQAPNAKPPIRSSFSHSTYSTASQPQNANFSITSTPGITTGFNRGHLENAALSIFLTPT